MRAHHVIEGMHLVREMCAVTNSAGMYEPETWDALEELYAGAVNFDFGDAEPSPEHVEFGTDLHDKRLFVPPFPIMFISSNKLGDGHSILLSKDEGREDDSFIVISTNGMAWGKDKAESDYWPVPVCGMTVTHENIDWKQLLNTPYARRSTGEDIKFDGEVYSTHVSFAYGAVAMLMSKDVEQHIQPTPVKLNKARERKGKVPIRETRVITIRTEALRRGAGQGGTHASPKMHWRRGHLRKLASGNVVPVAPTIVNATDDLRDEVAKKEYKVQA